MLRAGALAYVIVVSLIISTILSSLIALSYFNRKTFIDSGLQHRMITNANSGFALLLASPEITEAEIDLFDEGNDSVTLQTRQWGVFEIASAKAHYRNKSFSKTGLIGYSDGKFSETALYLADLNRPLSLAGKTNITGNAYLPEAGVKRAYIERQNFVGSTLINGQQFRSQRQLPKLNTMQINYLREQFTYNGESTAPEGDSLENSFASPPVHVFAESSMLDGYFGGNIIIHSRQPLIISSRCKLTDVQIYAPKITIERGFRGNAQFFSDEFIELQEDVHLAYPSALAYTSGTPNSTPDQRGIVVGPGSTVSGIVVMEQQTTGRDLPKFILSERAILHGEVYVNGLTELHGAVWGSVYTTRFYLKTPSSIYENHLLNAEIDVTKRHPKYVGSNIVEKSDIRNVIKWLN